MKSIVAKSIETENKIVVSLEVVGEDGDWLLTGMV